MPRETTQNRDEKVRQRSPNKSTAAEPSRGGSGRERSIETQRDRSADTSLSRQPAPGAYGPGMMPMNAMHRLAEDMNRLFESFGFGRTGWGVTPAFGGFADRAPGPAGTAWIPQIETFRRGDKFVVRADLPGLRKEDVNVEVENDRLTISGERSDEFEEDRDDFYRSERSYGRFFRAIPLPEGTNSDEVDASFNDGVLEITVPAPKEKERKSRRLQIR